MIIFVQKNYFNLKNSIIFFLIRFFRLFTNKYDRQISRWLSMHNWHSFVDHKKKSLEITTTVGCAMMCDYCPQTQYKTQGVNLPKVLNLDIFKKALKNVDKNIQINWTGFSEPLHHKNFCEMVEYCNEKGYEQVISTTMFGRERCQDFIANKNMFKSIVFHLPDNQNLMHLKTKDKYIFKLENAIRFQAKYLMKKNLELQVIGDNFDNKVRECINKLLKEKVIDASQIHIRKHLVSRAGQVNQIADIKMDKARKVDKKKNDLYYCSYGRLKKGVMISDGSLALCCCDYSLEHISGSLIKENLNEIYNHKLIFFNSHNNENNNFLRGSFNPCQRCEMYKRL